MISSMGLEWRIWVNGRKSRHQRKAGYPPMLMEFIDGQIKIMQSLREDVRSMRTEFTSLRNDVKEKGNKKSLTEIHRDEEATLNNKNTKPKIKRKDKVEIDGIRETSRLFRRWETFTESVRMVKGFTESQLKVKAKE